MMVVIFLLGGLVVFMNLHFYYRQKFNNLSERVKYYDDKLNFEQKEREKNVARLLDYQKQSQWLKDIPSSTLQQWVRDIEMLPDPSFPAIRYLQKEIQRRRTQIIY